MVCVSITELNSAPPLFSSGFRLARQEEGQLGYLAIWLRLMLTPEYMSSGWARGLLLSLVGGEVIIARHT